MNTNILVQTKETVEQEFYDSVYVLSHSYKTVQTYRTSINHLRKFLLEKHSCDEIQLLRLIQGNQLDVYQLLKQLIIYFDKTGISGKGIRSYLSGVKGYLRHLGIRINSDDFKQFVRVPKIVRNYEMSLDKKILNRLLHNVPPKLQVVILVASSSGLRIGELVQLKTSDIDFDSNPTKITVRGNTTKGKFARETFITDEATVALKDYLKSNFAWIENKPEFNVHIFGKTTNKGKKPKTVGYNPYASKMALQASLLYYLRKVPALQTKNENGYNIIHFHAFRKFCRTMVGNASGRDFAEALIGHQFYMDTYYQLTVEQKRKLYLKAETSLTISNISHLNNMKNGL